MIYQRDAYVLPIDLHQVLLTERISVSPTTQPAGTGAAFYAFVFDGPQEHLFSAFGSTPSEAVAQVLSLLGRAYVLDDSQDEGAKP